MSQIASFYLLKDGQRQELSGGDCSGTVYMAIWDWCESELDLDVRFPAPQAEDTLDCALLEGELASNVLAALREQDLPELAAEIAPDWDLPTEAVQSGLETLRSHLELVQGSWRLMCWQFCGSRTSRNWLLKLPKTGIYPPMRCKAGLKRCAPIWNWCRATLPCCMRCFKSR